MKYIYTIIALVVVSLTAQAQETFWNIQYNMSFGMGSQSDYISDASFRGFSVDGQGFITDEISVGGMVSWEVFDQIYRDLPPFEVNPTENISGNVSGTQYRYLNNIPIMLTAKYMLPEAAVRPYFGLGMGTNWVEKRTDIGLTSFVSDTWRFALQPEVGVFIPTGYGGGGISLTAKYRYATPNGDDEALSFFSLGMGFSFLR